MIANKTFSVDVLIDFSMTRLFLLAEYVCDKTSFACGSEFMSGQASLMAERRPQAVEPIPSKDIVPTIRFSNEDRMVEGDLFNLSEC